MSKKKKGELNKTVCLASFSLSNVKIRYNKSIAQFNAYTAWKNLTLMQFVALAHIKNNSQEILKDHYSCMAWVQSLVSHGGKLISTYKGLSPLTPPKSLGRGLIHAAPPPPFASHMFHERAEPSQAQTYVECAFYNCWLEWIIN